VNPAFSWVHVSVLLSSISSNDSILVVFAQMAHFVVASLSLRT
jgi:hypothetical protein